MKAKSKAGGAAPQGAPPVAQPTAAVGQPSVATNGSQPDYSAQWAEYYRSLGKHKEAEAIEAQMKSKVYSFLLFQAFSSSNFHSILSWISLLSDPYNFCSSLTHYPPTCIF